MSLEFNVPPRNEIASPLSHRPPLKHDGNLRYLDFIRLVEMYWEEARPDIPIKPVQSKTFTDYPVITYGLQNRVPFTGEIKPKQRENVINEDGEMYVVSAQKFQNTIVFTVSTSGDPNLAEALIEEFEDFMLEMTPAFIRLGAAGFIYARRLPDFDSVRVNEDVETRAVAYLMTEERIRQIKVDRLKDIVVNARVFLRQPVTVFTVHSGDQSLTIPAHEFTVGQYVIIYAPENGALPVGLHHGWTYVIAEITTDTVTLLQENGNSVNLLSSGEGRIVLAKYYKTVTNIEDLYRGATPTTT